MLVTSRGARNWPFLTFTAFPVWAHASMRSVWRQRNAGIWRRSMCSAAISASWGWWMSVVTGMPSSFEISPSILVPSLTPGPRNASPDVRFALSYDALK